MWLYVRPLTPEEQEQLDDLARSSDAVTYRHAQIIRLSAQGYRVPQIQAALSLSDRTVRDTIRRFNDLGPEALPRRKAPGQPRRCDPKAREALVELLHRPPSDFCIESRLWTADDLAAVAVAQGTVPALCADTVRREISRSGHSWQRAKRWTHCPDPEYSRKKDASSD